MIALGAHVPLNGILVLLRIRPVHPTYLAFSQTVKFSLISIGEISIIKAAGIFKFRSEVISAMDGRGEWRYQVLRCF
jgi:hypothetical protein